MPIEKGLRFTILFALFVFILGCGETQDAFYKDMDAARKGNAVQRGWIPDIIPESSTEIHERHDLDTNRVWICFKFDIKGMQRLIEQVQELMPTEIKNVEFISPGRVNWWPKKLNKGSFDMKCPQSGLTIYKYHRLLEYSDNRQKGILSFFAIDWDSNKAYYWQLSGMD